MTSTACASTTSSVLSITSTMAGASTTRRCRFDERQGAGAGATLAQALAEVEARSRSAYTRLGLLLGLLHPVRHPHLAVHRRRYAEVLLRQLAFARAPVELAEAEVAVGYSGLRGGAYRVRRRGTAPPGRSVRRRPHPPWTRCHPRGRAHGPRLPEPPAEASERQCLTGVARGLVDPSEGVERAPLRTNR
jgi:hypothetical protein